MTDDPRPEEEVTAEICAVCGHVFRPDETKLQKINTLIGLLKPCVRHMLGTNSNFVLRLE